jgi:hypothetical protein
MTTEAKKPSLAIEGRLPFEDYASEVNIGDLLKILVNKGVISVDDYELLVMRAHMIPRIEAMDENNWEQIKAELLKFLDRKNWQFAHPETGPAGRKKKE